MRSTFGLWTGFLWSSRLPSICQDRQGYERKETDQNGRNGRNCILLFPRSFGERRSTTHDAFIQFVSSIDPFVDVQMGGLACRSRERGTLLPPTTTLIPSELNHREVLF